MAGTPDEARIAPIPPKEWPSAMRAAMAALAPPNARHPIPGRRDDRPKALNLLGTFAHYPELVQAYHTFNGHLLFATSLSERQRELLVLRVAHVRGAEYEWRQHLVVAGDAGISPDEIVQVKEGPDSAGWSPLEAAMIRSVDELLAGARISDTTWAALSAELDTRQLFDLVFTVGAYDVLAMAMLSFGVQLDPDLEG